MSPLVSQANLSSCVLAITLMNTQMLGIRFMSMCKGQPASNIM